jgi:putative peptidoglycan lipid II flippase
MVGIATVMTAGSVAVFQFAFNLQSVPLAIIGMSYSVAAFPALSHLYAKRDNLGFNLQLLTALRHIIFWSIPVIGLVIVLRAQIVRVLLGSGQFDWSDTRLTAAVLAIFVVSLVAQAALLLMIRAFYAGGKTRLPLMVVSGGATLSVIMAIWLQSFYASHASFAEFLNNLFRLNGVPGAEILVLPIAFIFGQFVQLLILLILSAKTFKLSYRPLAKLCIQSILASLAGGFTAYITLVFVVDGINQETFIGIFLQGLIAGMVGLFAIVSVYSFLGSHELREIYRSFHTRILKTDVVAPQGPEN